MNTKKLIGYECSVCCSFYKTRVGASSCCPIIFRKSARYICGVCKTNYGIKENADLCCSHLRHIQT